MKDKAAKPMATAVDLFWGMHTVRLEPFESVDESLMHLEMRFGMYPKLQELMDMWGQHDGQVVLDYGCGPGNDLVGFLVNTQARKVIGVDISQKALDIASQRLKLHGVDAERVKLVKVSDAEPGIPLGDDEVDYIYSSGVLQHTSDPLEILKEFRRILKPDGEVRIMVYNRASVWFHLYVAYDKIILQDAFPGLDADGAFARTTDTEACPIAHCYQPEDFALICEQGGFSVEFQGGYLSELEVELFNKLGEQACQDNRLGNEHRMFLDEITLDGDGLPQYCGKYAGIGGVYRLVPAKSFRQRKSYKVGEEKGYEGLRRHEELQKQYQMLVDKHLKQEHYLTSAHLKLQRQYMEQQTQLQDALNKHVELQAHYVDLQVKYMEQQKQYQQVITQYQELQGKYSDNRHLIKIILHRMMMRIYKLFQRIFVHPFKLGKGNQ